MFDLRKHNAHEAGKPKSVRRAGMQKPQVETFLEYQIEITQRPASPISTRILYSVRVDGGEPLLRSYMTGFLTEKSARAAAHAEIQKLEFKYGQNPSPIASILSSLKRQRAAKRMQKKQA
ncbi:hypothetical protein C5Y96_25060 [Blastopirellula marina]|uniref:Uncharacterized protein n=1 Tax=Blastopirellula marina TaxID=124 RepID=A0A2S8EZ48_9BACT|nr:MULTISPECIES: hypothetical protein [Pirellulaceae]PQO25178.1 hypothetical protein C5Y96_25060 [Blastopirellula marina]RCS41611.1 hypothetical protein DTL36_25110 [Bremerella cremea]